MDLSRLAVRKRVLVGVLAILIAANVSGAARICQRKTAKGINHVFFMPSSRPFVYVMYSEAERKDISDLRQAYLDTVTYLYGKVATSPKTPPQNVRASKILDGSANKTIYVLHVQQPAGMTVAQSNVLYSAFGEFIDLKVPASLQIQNCDDSTFSQDFECPVVPQSAINGIVTYDSRVYNGNTPTITPVTPTNGKVPIGTYANITTCAAGFAPSVQKSVLFICGHIQGPQTTAAWNLDASMKAYCEPVPPPVCNALTAGTGGVISYSPTGPAAGVVPVNTVATLTCNAGYTLTDTASASATCTGPNTWSKILTSCTPVCPTIPAPSNGAITYSPTTVPFFNGAVATVTCNAGYQLSSGGLSSVTCTNSVWINQASLATCTPVPPPVCNALTAGTGGVISYSPTGPAAGVVPVNTVPPPVCNALTAGTGGVISYSPTGPAAGVVPVNTVATLTCNAGYTLTDTASASATCTGPNTWSKILTSCTPVCPTIPAPSNGAITYSPTTVPFFNGAVATVTCNAGYQLSSGGLSSVTCTNSVWVNQASLATCTPVPPPVCNALTAGTGGVISYSPTGPAAGVVPVNTVATLTCNAGYTLTDTASASATCTGSNTWNKILTSCIPVCPTIPAPSNGAITYSPTTVPFFNGAVATVTCNAGYQLSSGGLSSVTCTNSVWVNQASLATCTPVPPPVCNALTAGTGGVISYSPTGPAAGVVPVNTVATLTCNAGYKLTDTASASATCTAPNTWNKILTSCTPVCNVQPAIANGVITYSPQQPTSGTVPTTVVATLTCNTGYTLADTTKKSTTCTGPNTWSAVLTTCKLPQCIDPTTLFTTMNSKTLTYTCTGVCTGVQPVGKTVKVNCKSGDTVFDATFDDGTTGREDKTPDPETITLICNPQGKWQTTLTNSYSPYPPPIVGTLSNTASVICREYFGI
uniref:Sushi domain-containing protein n=1 Tax=Plectus sambesii TaxID=2011161 RepID=A0A914UY84_9BILA